MGPSMKRKLAFSLLGTPWWWWVIQSSTSIIIPSEPLLSGKHLWSRSTEVGEIYFQSLLSSWVSSRHYNVCSDEKGPPFGDFELVVLLQSSSPSLFFIRGARSATAMRAMKDVRNVVLITYVQLIYRYTRMRKVMIIKTVQTEMSSRQKCRT